MKRWVKNTLTATIAASVLVSSFSFSQLKFRPTKTYAVVPTTTTVDTPRILEKAWRIAKDAALSFVKKQLIMQIVDQTVEWIQNGAEGKPRFITNWREFSRDAASRAIGDVIADDPTLGFLCKPFSARLKITLPLAQIPKFSEDVRCTADEIYANIKKFSSDFRAGVKGGEWFGFRKMWEPQNNFIGASIIGEYHLLAEQEKQVNLDLIKGLSGGGFLGMEDKKGNINTPGATVGSQVAQALNLGGNSILSAREVDEIVGALVDATFNLLLKKGAKGLANVVHKSDKAKTAAGQKWEAEYEKTTSQNLTTVHSFYIGQIDAVLAPRQEANSFVDKNINLVNNFKDPNILKHCPSPGVGSTALHIQNTIFITLQTLAIQVNNSAYTAFIQTGKTATTDDLTGMITARLATKKDLDNNNTYIKLLSTAKSEINGVMASKLSSSEKTAEINDINTRLENDAFEQGKNIADGLRNADLAQTHLVNIKEDQDIKTITREIDDANKEICQPPQQP